MKFTPKGSESGERDALYASLEPVAKGLGLALVELTVSRHQGGAQVRAVVYKKGVTGLEDCSAFHHACLPRLDLAFPGEDLYVEVSSPGIDRQIKDAAECVYYIGQGIRCYRTDTSGWSEGVLEAVDERGIDLKLNGERIHIAWENIAKAKLAS
jgi:ribosome maturation factor RimP